MMPTMMRMVDVANQASDQSQLSVGWSLADRTREEMGSSLASKLLTGNPIPFVEARQCQGSSSSAKTSKRGREKLTLKRAK